MISQGAIPFYCIRFRDTTADIEMISNLLSEMELPASSWRDMETGERYHTFYYTEPEARDEALPDVEHLVNLWKEMGAQLSDLECFDLPPEDWAEAWKRFFEIQHLSPTLVIKPEWLTYEATPEQTVIEINPGMSFGTGRHATTVFCLRQIEQLSKKLPHDIGVLDAGCGSGILAIAASKFGFSPIDAFDYDEMCIPCSEENAQLNGLPADAIRFYQADLTQYPTDKTYGLVIANILAVVLLAEAERLYKLTQPNGYLVLAGILSTEYHKIKAKFETLGLKEIATETGAEWTGGAFYRES